MRKKVTNLRYLLLLLLFLLLFSSQTAWALESVQIDSNICSNETWRTDKIPLAEAPLRFELSDGHKDMNVLLFSTLSYAIEGDVSEALGVELNVDTFTAIMNAISLTETITSFPGVVSNVYSVYFVDYDGNIVWSEYGAIPNGGHREFFVGSNVKYIYVYSNNLAFLNYVKAYFPGRVGYGYSYEIE